VTELYNLETGYLVFQCYQMPPFVFRGVSFPAGSWIARDVRLISVPEEQTAHRHPFTDGQFQALYDTYGYHAVAHLDEAFELSRIERARRKGPPMGRPSDRAMAAAAARVLSGAPVNRPKG
jgi:hypothetical protein